MLPVVATVAGIGSEMELCTALELLALQAKVTRNLFVKPDADNLIALLTQRCIPKETYAAPIQRHNDVDEVREISFDQLGALPTSVAAHRWQLDIGLAWLVSLA